MKKKLLLMLSVPAFACTALLGLGACNKGPEVVTISNFEWGFVTIDPKTNTIPEGAEDGPLDQPVFIDAHTNYLLEYRFTVQSDSELADPEKYKIDVTLTMGNSKVIRASLYESNDAAPEYLTFADPTSGESASKCITHIYPPQKSTSAVKKTIKLLYYAYTKGAAQAHVSFKASDNSNVKVAGDDGVSGFTKAVNVNAVKLQQPVVSYNEAKKTLQWKHIENATYYKLVVDNSYVNDESNNQLTIAAPDGAAPGDTITYDISTLSVFSDHAGHKVKIQASSTDLGYSDSEFSPIIDVTVAA